MTGIIVSVKLWVKDSRYKEFELYEAAVFKIMKRHGVEVIKIEQDHAQDPSMGPHETHVLGFSDRRALDGYRTDPDVLALAHIRMACIAHTEIEVSERG